MIDETTNSAAIVQAGVNESGLINILKTYCQLCRNVNDKNVLLQDPTLVQTLIEYVGDKNLKVSLYVCKILLILTELSENATVLANNIDLLKSISLACENGLPPKIVKNLFIVQSRLINAKRSEESSVVSKKTFFNKANKQFIFSFDHPTETQKRQMEKNCLDVRGVVSVCFQLNSTLVAKCIVRCRDGVEAKTIASRLLQAGFEVVQLHFRIESGREETFDFYANDETLSHDNQKRQETLPKYLDERLMADDGNVFDPHQCIVTKEQLNAEQKHSAWFSLSSLKFW